MVGVNRSLPTYITGVTLLVIGFGVYQNSGTHLGGSISPPKVLWLNFALISFFVIPGYFAKNDPLFRWVFWSFMVRGLIEAYLLIETNAWRCWMGMTHNLFTLLGAMLLWRKKGGNRFAPMVAITLLVESVMALIFSRVASPEDGIYFASADKAFDSVNRFTWLVVGVVYPWLIWLVWKPFKGGEYGDATGE